MISLFNIVFDFISLLKNKILYPMDKLGKLNKTMLFIPKILYLTAAAAFYSLHQFRGQFILSRYENITEANLGIYLGLAQFLSFFINLVIGYANDKSGKQKLLIMALFLSSAVFFDTFFWTHSETIFAVLYIFYLGAVSGTIPLLDKVIMDYVSDIPELGAKAFGRQRIWSTFGYLAANFVIEDIVSIKGSSKKNWDNLRVYNLVAVAVFCVFAFLFVRNIGTRPTNMNYLATMKPLFANFEYMYFIGIILLCGISRAFMTNYLSLYCSKVLKFDKQKKSIDTFWPLDPILEVCYSYKQSTSCLFGVLLELIVFFNSSYITDKLGLLLPILFAQIFQLLRFVCYYFLSHDNKNSFILVCCIELLKGANYSLIHTSALQLASALSPPNLKTSSQLVYNGVFVAIGTVLSGLIFKGFFKNAKPGKKFDVDIASQEFKSAFLANIIFSAIVIVFFLAKYAIYENLVFNRKNTDAKLEAIQNSVNLEEMQRENEAASVK